MANPWSVITELRFQERGKKGSVDLVDDIVPQWWVWSVDIEKYEVVPQHIDSLFNQSACNKTLFFFILNL